MLCSICSHQPQSAVCNESMCLDNLCKYIKSLKDKIHDLELGKEQMAVCYESKIQELEKQVEKFRPLIDANIFKEITKPNSCIICKTGIDLILDSNKK